MEGRPKRVFNAKLSRISRFLTFLRFSWLLAACWHVVGQTKTWAAAQLSVLRTMLNGHDHTSHNMHGCCNIFFDLLVAQSCPSLSRDKRHMLRPGMSCKQNQGLRDTGNTCSRSLYQAPKSSIEHRHPFFQIRRFGPGFLRLTQCQNPEALCTLTSSWMVFGMSLQHGHVPHMRDCMLEAPSFG